MKDFVFSIPTEIFFGKDVEKKAGSYLKSRGVKKVLIHYGGGSAERSGLLGVIRSSLKEEGISFVELGGVKPNPVMSKVYEGRELCLKENVDFILAVGGGSVIDSSKCMALAAANPDDDAWDYFIGKKTPKGALPIASVLTIAAAGSELGAGMVLTNENGFLKRGNRSPFTYPKAAFLNPALMASLPDYHRGAGVTDVLVHTLERFFTPESGGEMTDAIAEALMRTVIKFGPEFYKNAGNYEAASEIMWAGSLSHNNLTGLGAVNDFSTHGLGHELSGKYDAIHGATLAAMWGSWARYVADTKPGRFARYAKNVWALGGASDSELAEQAIRKTEDFYRQLGMPVSIKELMNRSLADEELNELADKCAAARGGSLGSFRVLQRNDILAIYKNANG